MTYRIPLRNKMEIESNKTGVEKEDLMETGTELLSQVVVGETFPRNLYEQKSPSPICGNKTQGNRETCG